LIAQSFAFTCYNGSEIEENDVCSNLAQCDDCEDEMNCPDQADFVSCQETEGFRTCVSSTRICDGIQNCMNCYDERDCYDFPPLFHCKSGETCVGFRQNQCPSHLPCNSFCNGHPECADRSDEKQVGFGFKCSTNVAVSNPLSCVVPQEYLRMGFQFPEFNICENKADKCLIAIDKNKTIFNETKCWTCLDGTIVQRKQVCDAIFDCPDLSDECLCFGDNNAASLCEWLFSSNCGVNKVTCPVDGKCIDVSNICDEQFDCADNSDELYCKNNTTSNCESEVSAEEEISCTE